MGLVPVLASPGICKSSSDYGAGKAVAYQGSGSGTSFRQLAGRYSDGDKVRFVAGFAEKIGGWLTVPDLITPTGVVRNLGKWNTTATPGWEFPSTLLATPFATVSGSPIVTVTQVAHGQSTGAYASYQGASSSVGLDYNATFSIIVTGADTYTINLGTNASGTNATDGGATVYATFWTTSISRMLCGSENGLYVYNGTTLVDITPRRFFNPHVPATLTTVAGSHVVTVNNDPSTAPAAVLPGGQVFIDGSVIAGGVTFSGCYTVLYGDVGGGAGTVKIYSPTAAVSSGTGTDAGTPISWDGPKLINPFTVVSGNHTVTVLHTDHGAATGDIVTYYNASSFFGIDYNTSFTVTVLSPSQYTIQVAASPSGSGPDGNNVVAFYNVSNQNVQSTSQNMGVKGWTSAAYGNQMLCAPIGGTIYVYDPTMNFRPIPLFNAPTGIQAMFVTPERFVVALGNSNNAQQMSWADQTDYTNWTSTPTNTANAGRTLQGGSKFFCGVPVQNGVSLIFMDRALFELNYTGDNNVYASPLIANTTGIVGPYAAVTSGGIVYWIGGGDFWQWNGSISPLPSDDIREYVFDNINKQYIQKCFAAINKIRKEVWFFYPRGVATEITDYVIFHTDQGIWSIGTLARTCWADADLFPYPLAFDPDGALLKQEYGVDADGAAMDSNIVFAPIDIGNGDMNMDIMGCIPDFARLTGNINLIVNTRAYPQDTNTANGPYVIADNDTTPLLDFRADGKMVGYELQSNVIGGDFRIGVFRLQIQQAGARL